MNKPLSQFRVVVAFDHHRVGDVIEPTGILRDRLLRLKFIVPLATACALLDPIGDQNFKVRKARR